MKKTLQIITAAALLLFTVICAVAAEPFLSEDNKQSFIGFAQGVNTEQNITAALYPSYAPDLINKDGKSDQWGAGIALTYHPKGAVGQYTFTGVRLDYLGSQFWAPSVNGGLKADVQIFGVNFTPIAYTGLVVPLGGAGSENGSLGVIAGGGVKTKLWTGKVFGKDADLSVGVAAEKWSNFDGMIYHLGPLLRIAW